MPLTNFPFGGFFAKPSVRAALPGSALLSAKGAGFDLVGKVLQVNDPTGTYGFSYDNMGRLIGTTTQYTFLPSNNFTNSYTYDANSNRLTLTDPQGGVTSYAYDTLNRLSTLTPPTAFSSTGFSFTYDALSRRTQMTRPNGVTTNYTYDNLSHLLSVLHQVSSSTIDGAAYTYDSAGNRTAKTNEKTAVTSNYTYDPLYELTKVTQSSNTTESYSYDPVGSRLSSLGVSSYTNNSSNELTSSSAASYAYDANGNTTSKTVSGNTTTYSWDYENRLTSVVLPGTGGTVAFKYDGFGHRVQKAFTQGSTTTTTNYLFDGANPIEDVDQNANVLARYEQTTNIDEPLAELRSGTTSYYQADGLGSVTSLSSSAGALASTYTYDSFGNLTASTGSITNRFQYTGREFDSETGIYYYRARYYDQNAGRFLSEDPSRFSAGINFYAYVRNQPVDFLDPYGLKCTQVTPWQEVPIMGAPGSDQPYLTRDVGLWWTRESWQFANGPEGSTPIGCICTWISGHTRVRKYYRKTVEEEAWFECADCGKPSQRIRETRPKTKEWSNDSPGTPILPTETRRTPGATMEDGGETKCLCPPPSP